MTKKQKKETKRRMFRLLPLTITMLSLLLVVKVNELVVGSKHLREIYTARDAQAEDKKPDAGHAKTDTAEAPKATPATPASAETKPTEHAAPAAEAAKPEGHGSAKATSEHAASEEKTAAGEHEAESSEHGAKSDDGHGGSAKPPEEPRTYGTGKSTIKDIEAMKAKEATPRYTQSELDLLQNLSKRRDELDRREKDLEIKSKVLEATDKRIGDKMNEMKTLQGELSGILAQYNQQQDSQLKSLIKIYENMKPEEAANIFNEMDMPILLDVIGKMSERKVAPILANMNPKKAKDVTQELADKRKKLSLNGSNVFDPAKAK